MTQALHLFDAYGTLFDVHSAVARHRDLIGAEADRLSELWRVKQLEYTWVHSLTGHQIGFRQLLGRSLDYAAARMNVPLTAETRTALLAAYDSLTPYPEVRDALLAVKRKKSRVAILSNGDPDLLDNATRAAGIRDLLDDIISVVDVGVFKPSGRVYRLGMTRFGVDKGAVTFVSSNRWDVAGARQFGFSTVWVNRAKMPDEYPDTPANQIVASLTELPILAG